MSARRSDYAELELDEEPDEPDFVEAVDFDIAGYRLRGDWAALVISGPGTERVMVLAARGPEGWSVVDVGADLTQEYLYERGAPQDIVDFLCPT